MSVSIPNGLTLMADRDALIQILDNLVRNAVAAMGGTGLISLRFEQERGAGHLVFADDGPGIPAHLKSTLFDPFVSGSKTGTGLGLAIVRTLVERSGWHISLRPGTATCFDITIPEGSWRLSS
jgi:signal transduction histidine kinase